MKKTIAGTIGATAAAGLIAGSIFLGGDPLPTADITESVSIYSIIGVESSRAGTTIHYAEWKLVAETAAIYAALEVYSQNYEATGPAVFLLANDAELAFVTAELYRVGISHGKEENVALTARQKDLLVGTNVTSRSDVPGVLKGLERIDAIPTTPGSDVDKLKQEMLRSSASRAR